MASSQAVLNTVSPSTGLTGGQMIGALVSNYPSFQNAMNTGKVGFSDLARVAQVYTTMLGSGVYQEISEPLYDTVTLASGAAPSSQYNFFSSNVLNTGKANVSNSPDQQRLPATMAFLATKALITLKPTVYTGYVLNTITAPTAATTEGWSSNALDLMNVFDGASVRFQFLQSEWLEVPIANITYSQVPIPHGIIAGTYTAPATVAVNTVQLGPVSPEGIPEFKEYMFIAPQESFSIQLKFANGFAYSLVNAMNVKLELQGVKYRSA